jgi:hypothetical protein
MTPTGRRSDMPHYQEVLRRGRAPFGITTTSHRGGRNMSRNPFGVQDAPDPDGENVTAFASGARLTGSADDDNAEAWDGPDDATKQGLIEARWDGQDRLIGRYLNLSAPEITRPWVGLIVDATRIDGEHSGGRIDFRR